MITRKLLVALERVRISLGAESIAFGNAGFTVEMASERVMIALCGDHDVTPEHRENATHTWLSAMISVGDEMVWVFGPHIERAKLPEYSTRSLEDAAEALEEAT